MARTNSIIGFPRVGSYFTLSGGSWNASYPLSRLQSLPLSKIARSTDALATSTVIKGSCATQTRRCGVIGLIRHNMTVNATIRIRLFSDAAWVTPIYDSGVVEVWPVVYSSGGSFDEFEFGVTPFGGTLDWEDDPFWDGKYTSDEIAGSVWSYVKYFGQNYLASSFQIDIIDTGNAAGVIKIGYLELASSWQVSYDYEADASIGFELRSVTVEALGGNRNVNRRYKPRTFNGNFVALESEIYHRHLERFRQLDIDQPFLWIPNPDHPENFPRVAYLAQHNELSPFRHVFLGAGRIGFSIKEVIA